MEGIFKKTMLPRKNNCKTIHTITATCNIVDEGIVPVCSSSVDYIIFVSVYIIPPAAIVTMDSNNWDYEPVQDGLDYIDNSISENVFFSLSIPPSQQPDLFLYDDVVPTTPPHWYIPLTIPE